LSPRVPRRIEVPLKTWKACALERPPRTAWSTLPFSRVLALEYLDAPSRDVRRESKRYRLAIHGGRRRDGQACHRDARHRTRGPDCSLVVAFPTMALTPSRLATEEDAPDPSSVGGIRAPSVGSDDAGSGWRLRRDLRGPDTTRSPKRAYRFGTSPAQLAGA